MPLIVIAALMLAGFVAFRVLRGRARRGDSEPRPLTSEELMRQRERRAARDSVLGWEELDQAIVRSRLPPFGGL